MADVNSPESETKNQFVISNLSGDFVLPLEPCRTLIRLALHNGAHIDAEGYLCKRKPGHPGPLRLSRTSWVMLMWLRRNGYVVWSKERGGWIKPAAR